jgi:serine/threonine protein kinase
MSDLLFPGAEVLAELGRGTSGIVYSAKYFPDGRVVAVKVLLRADSREALEQFYREARSLAHLTKNSDSVIPSMYLVGESQGRHFHVREFIDGDTLEHRVAARAIDLRSALQSLAVVASAVARIHEFGLAHGNLHPSNVLVAIDGTTKLIGFGQVFARQTLPGCGDVDSLRNMAGWLCSELRPEVKYAVESALASGTMHSAADFRTRLDHLLDELK